MADILAGIAPQKDTYANWVTLNPTLGKTDSGNDYSQMIFATGSPVGDILIWGMAQSFTTAFTAKQYVIQSGLAEKVVLVDTADHYAATEIESALLEIATQQNILPTTHDISAGNVTKTLPLVTGYYQRVPFYVTGGDGTYKLTVAVTNSETVGGLVASTWTIEGDGHMVVESDGSNWQVKEYEDSGGVADSGADKNRLWYKYLNGVMELKGSLDFVYSGTSSLQAGVTFGKTFNIAPVVSPDNLIGYGVAHFISCGVRTVATTTSVLLHSRDTNGVNATGTWACTYTATGRWRT